MSENLTTNWATSKSRFSNVVAGKEVFDGNPEVMIAIGCVTNDRLRESPPPGKCKHNVLVVFDC